MKKFALIAATAAVLATPATAQQSGLLDRALREEGSAIESGFEAAAETPQRVRRLQRTVNTLGLVNIALYAGVAGTADIEIVEPMGSETLAWTKVAGLPVSFGFLRVIQIAEG